MTNDNNHRDHHIPVYNIKAVSRLVGLLPVTLRAWERRYGIPSPLRGNQGYRLYSDHDLNTLRWLKQQVDAGMSVGRAVDYLHELRRMGQDPALLSIQPGHLRPSPASASASSLQSLQDDLLGALTRFDNNEGVEILRRAFALFSMERVLLELITPTLVTIGDRWHAGNLPIAVEHFASQFFMQQLMGILSASAPPTHPGSIIAACAPGETHQIGLLMISVMLRWRGWDVKYLGPDLNLERLEEALEPVRPTLLLFSANRPETAHNLLSLPAVLERFGEPKPLVVVGGPAFQQFRLPDSFTAIYMDETLMEAVIEIEHLMTQRMQHRLR